jgi:Regulator of chromosome condensation (RCC1) repeat
MEEAMPFILGRGVRFVGLLGLMLSAACGSAPAGAPAGAPAEDPDGELTGEATLAVTTVPSGIQCIEVVAAGSKTVTKDFTTSAGSSSASLSLGRLPLGTVKFTASAFEVACSALSGATATWVADPTTSVLKTGVISKLTLSFRKVNSTTATANFVDNIAGITAGHFATYLMMADGGLRAAGISPFASTKEFANVAPTFGNIAEIAGGELHVCFRKKDGTVWCAGSNSNGQVGPGISIGTSTNTPVQVPLSGPATQITAAGNFSCALVNDAQIFCWGANESGQLGNGTTTQSSTPVQVAIFGRAGRLGSGFQHACFSEGSITSCWGNNVMGQLGDGTTTNRSTPVQVLQLGATVSLELGDQHSCAVRADGTLRCWGINGTGELGDGTTTNRSTPTLVSGMTDVIQVAAGGFNTCALRQSGTVACWGFNFNGEVGDGSGEMQVSPKDVAGLTNVTAITMGRFHVCALLGDQTVRCWGDNSTGALGDGTAAKRFRPVASLIQ